ncbi:MAG: methyltransferase domain-containing protein [Gammaproteobacteria bacterium]|nr:MAG: methyltransferase domain-containing protein [Gammaproteobacteria bacterium]
MQNPFDSLADAFTRKIYGSLKGQLRLQGIQRDLCEALGVSALTAVPESLSVLDIGAGDARISSELARSGCSVTVVEPSAALMSRARERFAPDARVHFEMASWEAISRDMAAHDLVLVHAVLEWLNSPGQVLPSLVRAVRPGGWLSVAFYNRHGIVMRNLAKGNLRKVESGDFSGMQGGLTPRHAFDPVQLQQQFETLGMEMAVWSGLRTFYDFIPRHVRPTLEEEDICRLEARFSRMDPYRQLASYQHMVFRKPL